MVAIINANPAVKDSGHYFEQENNNQLGIVQTRVVKKFCFGDEPCKQYKITSK